MLEIRNLTKTYKPKKGVPVVALDNISLKFPDSGMIFLLGKGLVAGLATEGTRTMTFTGTYLAMFAERGRGYFKELNVKVSDADKEDDR